MDAWEWIAILVGGATAAWMLYEKGKESGRQKAFEEFREPPGTGRRPGSKGTVARSQCRTKKGPQGAALAPVPAFL